jgi:hypothetical protein
VDHKISAKQYKFKEKSSEPSVMEFRCPHKRINDDRASVAFRKYLKDPKTKAPGWEEAGAFWKEEDLY